MKISIRLIIIFCSLALVWGTHLIITPSSYIMSERVLTRHAKDIMQNISDLTVEQSFNHLHKAKSAAFLAKQLLSSNVVTNEVSGFNSLERYFFDQLSVYPHLAGIYFGAPNGNFFYVSRNEAKIKDGFRTKIILHNTKSRSVTLKWRDSQFNLIAQEQTPDDTYDPRTRPWYIKALKEQQVVWTAPYIFFTSKKPGITIAGPSINEDGSIKGVVGVDIDIGELSTFIGKLRVGKSGQAFMLNRNGDLIASRDLEKNIQQESTGEGFKLPSVTDTNSPLLHQAFKSINWPQDSQGNFILEKQVYTSFSSNGKNYLGMFTPFPASRLPWIIGVYIPEDDYLGDIKANRFYNIIATLVISLLASWVGLMLARAITTPIINLEKEAKAIEEHDMKTTFETDSAFLEIHETAKTFLRMKTNLVQYRDRLLDNERIYRTITGKANDAIIMMDAGHRVSFWNPAAERMFGYAASEILGKDLHSRLAAKRYHDEISNGLERFNAKGQGPLVGQTLEVVARNKQGHEFPLELSLASLEIEKKWHAVAIARDITERKKGEQIKKRLVRDLHDGIGGNLTNIKLLAEIAKNQQERKELLKALSSITDISEDCLLEIRNYMNVLDDKDMNWESLITEIRQYCAGMLESHGVELKMDIDIVSGAPLPNTLLYMNLFKIFKEAVNNIVKHSDASLVAAQVVIDHETVQVIIKDDGTGIEPSSITGRGLLSMESRTKELNGAFQVEFDQGVRLTIAVPLRSSVPETCL